MVLPSNSLPADGSWVARKIAAMDRQVQELSSVVTGLKAIQAQQAFLSGQTLVDATSTELTQNVSEPASQFWPSASYTYGAGITFTAPESGVVAMQASIAVDVSVASGILYPCGSLDFSPRPLNYSGGIWQSLSEHATATTSASLERHPFLFPMSLYLLTPGTSYTVTVRPTMLCNAAASGTVIWRDASVFLINKA